MKRLLPVLVLGLVVAMGPDRLSTDASTAAPQNDSDAPTAVLTSCKGPVTIVRAGGTPTPPDASQAARCRRRRERPECPRFLLLRLSGGVS